MDSCICGVWFAETDQKRSSLHDLWEALRVDNESREKNSGKRVLNEDDDPEIPLAKRQRPLHDDASKLKYIALAERSELLDSVPEHSKSQRKRSNTDPILKDAMAFLAKLKVKLPLSPLSVVYLLPTTLTAI